MQRLAKLVDRSDLFVTWYGVDLDAHRSAAKFAGTPFKDGKHHGGNHPYMLLMPGVIMGVGYNVRQQPAAQRLELFLDEQNILKPDILKSYPDMLRALADVDPTIRSLMPAQPWFRDDREFLPLQAADLIAGNQRRRIMNSAGIVPLKTTKLRQSPNSHFLNGQDVLRFAQAHTRQKLVSIRRPRTPKGKGRRRYRCFARLRFGGAIRLVAASTRRNPSVNCCIARSGSSARTSGGFGGECLFVDTAMVRSHKAERD